MKGFHHDRRWLNPKVIHCYQDGSTDSVGLYLVLDLFLLVPHLQTTARSTKMENGQNPIYGRFLPSYLFRDFFFQALVTLLCTINTVVYRQLLTSFFVSSTNLNWELDRLLVDEIGWFLWESPRLLHCLWPPLTRMIDAGTSAGGGTERGAAGDSGVVGTSRTAASGVSDGRRLLRRVRCFATADGHQQRPGRARRTAVAGADRQRRWRHVVQRRSDLGPVRPDGGPLRPWRGADQPRRPTRSNAAVSQQSSAGTTRDRRGGRHESPRL